MSNLLDEDYENIFEQTPNSSHISIKSFSQFSLSPQKSLKINPKRDHFLQISSPISCKPSQRKLSIEFPYINGRKNTNYSNPTFISSVFVDMSAEDNASKSPNQTPRSDREERTPRSDRNENNVSKSQSVIKEILKNLNDDSDSLRNGSNISKSGNASERDLNNKPIMMPTFGDIKDENDNWISQEGDSSKPAFENKKKKQTYENNKENNNKRSLDVSKNNRRSYITPCRKGKETERKKDEDFERELEQMALEYAKKMKEKLLEKEGDKKISQEELKSIVQKKAVQLLLWDNNWESNDNSFSTIKSSRREFKAERNLNRNPVEKISISDKSYMERKRETNKLTNLDKGKVQMENSFRSKRQSLPEFEDNSHAQKSFLDKMNDISQEYIRKNILEKKNVSNYNLNKSLEKEIRRNTKKKLNPSYSHFLLQDENSKNTLSRNETSRDGISKSQEKIKVNSNINLHGYNNKQDKKSQSTQNLWTTKLKQTKPSTRISMVKGQVNKQEKSILLPAEKIKKHKKEITKKEPNTTEKQTHLARSRLTKNGNLTSQIEQSSERINKINEKTVKVIKDKHEEKRISKGIIKTSKENEKETRRKESQEKYHGDCNHKISMSFCNYCFKKRQVTRIPRVLPDLKNTPKIKAFVLPKPKDINTPIAYKFE